MGEKQGHTPGPWSSEKLGELAPASERMVVADLGRNESGIRQIRSVARTLSHAGADEAFANARLIAAAPDLLAAAQQALSHCGPNGYLDCGKPATDTLRAAISRATGEDSPANEGEGR